MSLPIGDVLSLEHIIGYTGRFPSTLRLHPAFETGVAYSLGPTVVLGDVTDPHEQIFLRKHESPVSALDVSPSGALLVSGQLHEPAAARSETSPVVLWDTAARRPLRVWKGVTGSVFRLAFSPDERFVAGAGADASLCVWDVASGEIVFAGSAGALRSGTEEPPVSVLCWTITEGPGGGRPTYGLLFNYYDIIQCAPMTYDARICKYVVGTPARAAVPASGFVRTYLCGSLDASSRMLLCGTTTGELVTYSLAPLLFKEALPVASHGLQTLLVPTERQAAGAGFAPGASVVFCGGGDGSVRRLERAPATRAGRIGAAAATGIGSGRGGVAGDAVAFAGAGSGRPYVSRLSTATQETHRPAFSSQNAVADGMEWVVSGRAQLAGRVSSLALPTSGGWLLAGSDVGNIYRIALAMPSAALAPGARIAFARPDAALGATAAAASAAAAPARVDLLESAHSMAVLALSFCPGVNTAVASCGADGMLRLWSLDSYDVIWAHESPAEAAAGAAALSGTSGGAGGGRGRGGGAAAPGTAGAAPSFGGAASIVPSAASVPPICLWTDRPYAGWDLVAGGSAAAAGSAGVPLTHAAGRTVTSERFGASASLHPDALTAARTSRGDPAFPAFQPGKGSGRPLPKPVAFPEGPGLEWVPGPADGDGSSPLPCQLYAGFADGTLRAYDVAAPSAGSSGRDSKEAWRAAAHKGGVTAVSGTRVTVISGGADGRVCIWARPSGLLLQQFADHARPVAGVLTDCRAGHLLYSVAGDRALNVYDLRRESRAAGYALSRTPAVGGATFTCITQNEAGGGGRGDGEVLCGTSHGHIVAYDVMVPDVALGVCDVLALVPDAAAPRPGAHAAGGIAALLTSRGGPADAAGPHRGGGGAGGASFAGMRNRSSLGDVLSGSGYGPVGPDSSPLIGGGGGSSAAGAAAAAAAAAALAGDRPECRVTGMAMAPGGRFLALVTHTGFLIVLSVGPSASAGPPAASPASGPSRARGPGAAGGDGSAGWGAAPHVLAAASRSSVTSMALVAVFRGFSPYTGVRWSPDRKQIIASAEDACIGVFNFFM